MTHAVTANGLSKTYGSRAAVNSLTFDIPVGSLTGFIGPNGAGKTTTLRMLVGLVRPTSGSGTVLGHAISEPSRYASRVGALIEGPAFYPGLSGADNLRVVAAAAGLDAQPIPELLDRVGLATRGRDPYKTYSHGMKQRLGIAAALLGDPELLILDEPANGLDPEGMHDMRELLRAVRNEGRTVLVSSHLLSELQQVCDWLVVIDAGQEIFQGKPSVLLGADRLVLRPESADDVGTLVQIVIDIGLEPEIEDGRVVAVFPNAPTRTSEIGQLSRAAAAHSITLVEIATHSSQLEQSYLNLIGDKR